MRTRLFTLILILMLSIALSSCGKKTPAIKIGDPLPPITLESIDGSTFTLPDAIRGKVATLLFWQEGCKYCEDGMPGLEALYQKGKERGLVIIGIQIGGKPDAAKKLAERFGVTFPMLIDRKSAIMKKCGIVGVPTMFVLDRGGAVREKVLGGLDAITLGKMMEAM